MIILIGPIETGKTTIGELLAQKLNLPQYSLDLLRWDYYAEIGYDDDHAQEIGRTQGFWAKYQHWKPFEIHAVERTLSEYRDCVLDFGAGHSVYEDETLFERARKALAPFPNVILLMPSPDADESIQILNERAGEEISINAHFIKHHSNYDLAKFIIYTKDKTPEAVCDEILGQVTMP